MSCLRMIESFIHAMLDRYPFDKLTVLALGPLAALE